MGFGCVNGKSSQPAVGDQLLDRTFDQPPHFMAIVARQPHAAQPPAHHAVDCVASTRIAPEVLLEYDAYRFDMFRRVHHRVIENMEGA